MMKLTSYLLSMILVLSFRTYSMAAARQSPFTSSYTDIYISLSSLAIGTFFFTVQVNKNKPLLESEVKSYRSETIPLWMPIVVHMGYAVTPFMIDRTDDVRHFRGFVFAISVNYAIQSSVASLAGRKRPNYAEAKDKGHKAERRSFYSGHAAHSFGSATYMSLYLKNHIESKSLKVMLPVLMFGFASYVAYTRVDEHFHHFSDVLVGAVSGTAFTYLSYQFFQNSNRRVGVSIGPESLKFNYDF